MMSQKITVLGSWHLGSVIGTCLADQGNQVHFWDQNKAVAEKWKIGTPPLFEPGLSELSQKYWGKNLFWCDGPVENRISESDWIIVAYDTPVDQQDRMILKPIEEAVDLISNSCLKENAKVLLTSQLPVTTSGRIKSRLKEKFPYWKGEVFYTPENLRLGEAIHGFKNPDRVVLGFNCGDQHLREKFLNDFKDLYQLHAVAVNVMSLESAEMVKHALNAFLANCVVFANEISTLCEGVNANAWDVLASLKQDSRVGPRAFLRPGLGFSGGTLARDVRVLSEMTQESNLFREIYTLNQQRNRWIVNKLKKQLKKLNDTKIVLLGVTYKPGTSTVRRSPALDIAHLLQKEGASCVAVDPMADLTELSDSERREIPFLLEKDIQKAFTKAHAAVVVTEWKEFKDFNWASLMPLMVHPVVVDTKGLLDRSTLGGFHLSVPGHAYEGSL